MRANTAAIEALTDDLPEFPELVRTHQRMVFSLACHFLNEQTSAEEVAQDVFLQLYRALPSMKSKDHVTASRSPGIAASTMRDAGGGILLLTTYRNRPRRLGKEILC